MSDETTDRAAEVLDVHTYATSTVGSGEGPRVCRCGHREKPQDGEPLQDVHRGHLLATLAGEGLLATPEHDRAVAVHTLREFANHLRVTADPDADPDDAHMRYAQAAEDHADRIKWGDHADA